jgi:carboxymethylenebutenolidase
MMLCMENDVTVNETPVLQSEGSRSFDSYLTRPQTGVGPGLLVFSEMWGVAESKTRMADDYAARGWCVLVPNMFWRSEYTGVVPTEQFDKAWDRLQAFDWERAVDDVHTAVRALRASPHCNGKVATIGFCMGGRLAFIAAARAGVDAAIALYALGIARHLDEVRTVRCPTQLHYGLNDRHIPQSEIAAVADAARGNRNVEVHLYPGAGHAFFSPNRPTYDPQAVAKATVHIDRALNQMAEPVVPTA